MASDLFAVRAQWDRLRIQDADVAYLRHLELAQPHAQILQSLIADVRWRSEEVVVWGRKMPQPRLVAWYGDAGRRYSYSGIQLDPLPWTPMLLDIKARVEETVSSTFNSVLLNYYRDNRDSMGFHSDDEPELGDRPVIASLSLGEERTFILKHKKSKVAKPIRLRLASGSVLLMSGVTQRYWQHGIPKESRPCGPRINLTFRTIVG
jgi:alkylated DNA repair dioxygenase AlkB